MAVETPIALDFPPGVVLTQSPLAAKTRFTGAQWVRFWRGKAQKIGGYIRLNPANTSMLGVPRGAWSWNDLTARQILATGTELKLYYADDINFTPLDITPWVTSATGLANPIVTAAGSNVVTINWTGGFTSAVPGQYLDISGASNVDNFAPNGSWPLATVVSANQATIIAPQNAVNSVTGGGAAVAFGLELLPGAANPYTGFGWGAGAWNVGTWNTPRSVSAITFQSTWWSFGNFGKILIANRSVYGLYFFDPTAAPIVRAAQIATAPTYSNYMVVTSDQIVIAFGSNFKASIPGAGGPSDQDLMQWWASAQGVYTNWDTTQVSGPNGSQSVTGRLAQGTRIVGAVDLGIHITLVWTDTALYEFQYTGSQFVFNILLSGLKCGLIGPHAFAAVGSEAYWVGPNGFFMFNGAVQRIPNNGDISEWVIQNLRPYFTIKTIAWYNQEYNEVWFAFVDLANQEPIKYVVVNRDDWTWTAGTLPERFSAAILWGGYDTRPLTFGSDGNIYQHDNTLDADGASLPWSLTYPTLELGAGEYSMEVSGVAMDMQRQVGNITAQLTTTDRTPTGATTLDSGTATVAPTDGMADFRVSGRQAQLTLSGSGLGCDMRLGVLKMLIMKGAGRR